jgi:hypothetical protein
MNNDSNRPGTEPATKSQSLSKLEREQMKQRADTLNWLSAHAERKLRRAWRGQTIQWPVGNPHTRGQC